MYRKLPDHHLNETDQDQRSPEPSYYDLMDRFYGNWIWRAVHALADHPQFNSSPSWISNQLSISIEEVVDALEGLEELGLIYKSDGSLKAKTPQFLLPAEKASKSYSIKKHRQISSQLLAQSPSEQMEATLAYFLSVKQDELHKVLRSVFQQFKDLDTDASRDERSQLYSINLTCVNLAPRLGKDTK